MNGIFRIDGPLYTFGKWTGRFFLLTVYWLLASLPVLTMGTACAAVLYVCRKWLAGDVVSLSHTFWTSFLDNLKQGIVLTILWTALLVIVRVNLQTWHFWERGGTVVLYLQWLILVFLTLAGIYALAITGGHRQSLRFTIPAAFLLVSRHPGASLMVLLGLIGYLSLLYYLPILVFFGAGVLGLWISYWITPVLAIHARPSPSEKNNGEVSAESPVDERSHQE